MLQIVVCVELDCLKLKSESSPKLENPIRSDSIQKIINLIWCNAENSSTDPKKCECRGSEHMLLNKHYFTAIHYCIKMFGNVEILYYRVYQKKCPKWKIASTSDIPQNLGYFLPASRSLLVYLGQKIIFPSKSMLPGGCFLSSNFEKACAQKCQPEIQLVTSMSGF